MPNTKGHPCAASKCLCAECDAARRDWIEVGYECAMADLRAHLNRQHERTVERFLAALRPKAFVEELARQSSRSGSTAPDPSNGESDLPDREG